MFALRSVTFFLLIALLAVSLVPGCITGEGEDGSSGEGEGEEPGPMPGAEFVFGDHVPVLEDCDWCEPRAAVAPTGEVYVTDGFADQIARWDVDTGVERFDPPPLPPEATGEESRVNNVPHAGPAGAFYFASLVRLDTGDYGIQVARGDGAGSWDQNTLLTATNHPSLGPLLDRPWIATANDGTLYLAYYQLSTGSIWVATSDDGGASFMEYRNVETVDDRGFLSPSSPPVVDDDGGVHVAYFAGLAPGGADRALEGGDPGYAIGAREVRVASAAVGDEFSSTTLYSNIEGETEGGYWPGLAAGEDGLHVSWRSHAGDVKVAHQVNGAWSPPRMWAETVGERAPVLQPGAGVDHEGRLVVTWFENVGSGYALVAAREDSGEVERSTVAMGLPGNQEVYFTPPTLPTDPCPVTTWSDGSQAFISVAKRCDSALEASDGTTQRSM